MFFYPKRKPGYAAATGFCVKFKNTARGIDGYMNVAKIVQTTRMGRLQQMKEGTQVSQMWSC